MANVASRRGFLAALAAFTGAGTAGAVALAPAEGIAVMATPDAELIAAGARWRQAVAFRKEAEARYAGASRAAERALGECPTLLVADWKSDEYEILQLVDRSMTSFAYENWHGQFGDATFYSWTGPTLRAALAAVPGHFGRGGRTPFICRRLRALLPLADARDAARSRLARHHGMKQLGKAADAARKAEDEAAQLVIDLPASTLAGIALKLRYADARFAQNVERGGWNIPFPDFYTAVHASIRDAVPV